MFSPIQDGVIRTHKGSLFIEIMVVAPFLVPILLEASKKFEYNGVYYFLFSVIFVYFPIKLCGSVIYFYHGGTQVFFEKHKVTFWILP